MNVRLIAKNTIRNSAIIFSLLLSTNAYSLELHPTISATTIYSQINHPDFEYSDRWNPIKNISSISVGLSLKKDNYILGLTTNRLFHKPVTRSVKSIQYGTKFKNESNIVTDTAYIGYQINKWQPALFLVNARVEDGLYENGTVISETTKHAIIYGASLGYFLTKNIEALIIYVAPNQELYLESGLGLGISYIF